MRVQPDHTPHGISLEAMDGTRSPAQLYALVFGFALIVARHRRLLLQASFATAASSSRDAVFGILDVNGWHNLVHIVTGCSGSRVAALLRRGARYALGFGAVYMVVAHLGLPRSATATSMLGIIPVNTEDNVLHLLIGMRGRRRGGIRPAAGARPRPS